MIKTLLLVSDDIDDQQAFTEAMEDFDEQTVVIAIVNEEMAFRLIKSYLLIPDFIFIDLTCFDLSKCQAFIEFIKQEAKFKTTLMAMYGTDADLRALNKDVSITFEKDYDYLQLRNILKKILHQ